MVMFNFFLGFGRRSRDQKMKDHDLAMIKYGIEQLLKWLDLVGSYDASGETTARNKLIGQCIERLNETKAELESYTSK